MWCSLKRQQHFRFCSSMSEQTVEAPQDWEQLYSSTQAQNFSTLVPKKELDHLWWYYESSKMASGSYPLLFSMQGIFCRMITCPSMLGHHSFTYLVHGHQGTFTIPQCQLWMVAEQQQSRVYEERKLQRSIQNHPVHVREEFSNTVIFTKHNVRRCISKDTSYN